MESILVSGAYGGMGRAAVLALKDAGYRVFALDKAVGGPEENIIPIKADITKEDEIVSALDTVKKYTDTLFAIVHFAGIYMLDSFIEIETVDFERIFRVNFQGAFLLNKLFVPLLQKGGRILITTSELASLDPLPFTGIYAVTKSALDKYAYSLRMELQLLGISVSVLRAGAVDTGMLGVSTKSLDRFCERTRLYSCNAERFKRIVEGMEARRIAPEKIAKKMLQIIKKNKPRFAYSLNRNPLLLLLGALPKRFQLWVIRLVLK